MHTEMAMLADLATIAFVGCISLLLLWEIFEL